MSNFHPPISRGVRALRISAGLSQTELADLAGVSLGCVLGIERARPGQTRKLARVLGALDVDLAAVLERGAREIERDRQAAAEEAALSGGAA